MMEREDVKGIVTFMPTAFTERGELDDDANRGDVRARGGRNAQGGRSASPVGDGLLDFWRQRYNDFDQGKYDD